MARTNRRTLALVRESCLLDELFPQGRLMLRAGVLRWTGELQPSEISRSYSVEVQYDALRAPRVFVRRPRLTTDRDGHLPHINRNGSLCLHEPGQWEPGHPIARTIVPWTCEWLLHYELWLATGEWHGSGGNHTGPIRSLSQCRRQSGRPRRIRSTGAETPPG